MTEGAFKVRSVFLTVFALGGALALAACGGDKSETDTADTQPKTEIAAPADPVAAPPAKALHLIRLDCGELDVIDMASYDRGGALDGQEGALAVSCWLVRHPNGNLLWELGLPTAMAGLPGTDSPPYTMYLSKTLSQQLAGWSIRPNDIDYVAFSSNHFEHIGQADQFPGATWVTTEAEKEDLFPTVEDPELDTAISEAPTLGEMTSQTFDGELDLFGDGSVKLIEYPGPSVGHKALLVDLPERGPVFLAGALFHSSAAKENKFLPTFFTDEAASLTSINTALELVETSGAELIIPYDFDLLASLPDRLD